MKKFLFLTAVAVFGFTLNHMLDEKVKSLLSQMKMSENDAEVTIFSNLLSPSFYIPGVAGLLSSCPI